MNKVLCPNCGSRMELFGVTDRGMWRFHCPECYTIIEKY